MPEQAETNPAADKNNKNLYPYKAIQLGLKDLLSRFGKTIGTDFVPLVFTWGSKGGGPFATGWSTRNWEELSAQPGYIEALADRKHNIGIRIGPNSGNYGNFDIDVPNRVITDALINFCPILADTLWTKGSKESGHSIWFKMTGDWPGWALGRPGIKVPGIPGRPKKDKNSGEIKENEFALEFRTQNGIQSIIFGLHENKSDHYEVVNDKPVIELEWALVLKIIKGTLGLGWRGWPGAKTSARDKTPEMGLGYTGNLEKRLRIIEELGYEILDVEPSGKNRVKVRCPNVENHSTAEKEGEAVIFPGTDERGIPAFHCLHSTCKTKDETLGSSFNQRETWNLNRAFAREETILYSPAIPIHETQTKAYQLMSEKGIFFNLNETVARWSPAEGKLEILSSLTIHSALSQQGIIVTREQKGKISPWRLLGEEAASLLAQKNLIRQILPEVKFTTNISFLGFDRHKMEAFEVTQGYHPSLKCLCLREEKLLELSLSDASKILDDFFKHWTFETPADKSRAIALFCSPMEVIGGWLDERAPCHLVTADQSNAGKTNLLLALCYVYDVGDNLHNMEDTPIGGLCQKLDFAVSEGHIIFPIDNLRGHFEVARLEMMITGSGRGLIRQAYERTQAVDFSRLSLFFTGNEGFKFGGDLPNRANVVKIKFNREASFYDENGKSVINKLRQKEEALRFRSALARLLKETGGIGQVTRHPFRFNQWAQLNNAFLAKSTLPDLTEGILERQKRIQKPELIFIEQAFELLSEMNLLKYWGSASVILKVLEQLGLEWPENNGKFKKNSGDFAVKFARLIRSQGAVVNNEDYRVYPFGRGFIHAKADSHSKNAVYGLSTEETGELTNDELLDKFYECYGENN